MPSYRQRKTANVHYTTQRHQLDGVSGILGLETLILSDPYYTNRAFPPEIRQDVVGGLLSQMDALRCVEVETESLEDGVRCERWKRDTPEAVSVVRPAISW